jgi:lysozyme
MLDLAKLKADLIRDEDRRLCVYDDATGDPVVKGYVMKGNPTIGVGRLLTAGRGLSVAETDLLLDNDLAWVFDDLDRNAPWWRRMPEPAQRALANQCFNMGWPVLAGFRNMLAALKAHDYETAANEAEDSKWFRQVGDRGPRIVALYREAATA